MQINVKSNLLKQVEYNYADKYKEQFTLVSGV